MPEHAAAPRWGFTSALLALALLACGGGSGGTGSTPPPPLLLAPTTLPGGNVGLPYQQTFSATGGTAPYTFALSAGSLPPGLALEAAGTLAGTPGAAATRTFTVRAADARGNVGLREYSLAISDDPTYLMAYDSGLQGSWVRACWEPSPNALATDFDAPAPGRPGRAIEVRFGPGDAWGAFGLADRKPGWDNQYKYLNEFRTLEFDLYPEADAPGFDNLRFILEDAGHIPDTRLVDLIPGWSAMTDAQRYGRWHEVRIELPTLQPDLDRFHQFLFFNHGSSASQPHFRLARVRLGYRNDTTPPTVTLQSATVGAAHDRVELSWTTDEPTVYRVDYGIGALDRVLEGPAGSYARRGAVSLTGLTPGSTCRFRIRASDHRTDPGLAPNVGLFEGSLELPPAPSTPPTIDGLSVSDLESHKASLAWTSDRPCRAEVRYARSGGPELRRTFPDLALSRRMTLDLLEPSTSYAVTVRVWDAFENSAARDLNLVTPGSSTADVVVTVDPDVTRPISPYIYGTNQDLGKPAFTLGRLGGNNWTPHNWEINAENAGADWYHWNYAYHAWVFGVPDAELDIPGRSCMAGVDRIFGAGSRSLAALVTVPCQGYVAGDRGTEPNADVRDSGSDYLATRFKQVQPFKGAPLSLTPDPRDGAVYLDEFVHWVDRVLKPRHPGKGIFYSLDNEPDLWAFTHPRIQAGQIGYEALCTRNEAAARAVKSQDPEGLVFGFVSYGWYGYTTLQGAPDGTGKDFARLGDFTDYYLAWMARAAQGMGRPLVDVLDLHYYSEAETPDGSAHVQGNGTSSEVVAVRVQAARSLWDPSYVEHSWITRDALPAGDNAIRLIPRMQAKIAAHAPGTRLAITEYNFRGGHHISGAIAQADALGIFGQEGLFAAARWRMNEDESFIEAAFRMFRGFDGGTADFGDVSLKATSSDVSRVAAYVSADSTRPGRTVMVLLNRTLDPQDLRIQGYELAGTARVYRLSADLAAPVPMGEVPVRDSAWTLALPPLSVTTVEVR